MLENSIFETKQIKTKQNKKRMKQQYILSILKQIPIITMLMKLYTRCSLRNEKQKCDLF